VGAAAVVDNAGSFGPEAIGTAGGGVLGRARIGTPVSVTFTIKKLRADMRGPGLAINGSVLNFDYAPGTATPPGTVATIQSPAGTEGIIRSNTD